jgi:molybdate transport system regulatory protein
MGRTTKKETAFAPHPRWRVAAGKNIAVGPGKIELLALIAETGSITKAASRMGMSYMRAWSLVKTMNECFSLPVVSTERGGRQRGGATLTSTGRQLLKLYRQMERVSHKAIQPQWRALARLLNK